MNIPTRLQTCFDTQMQYFSDNIFTICVNNMKKENKCQKHSLSS